MEQNNPKKRDYSATEERFNREDATSGRDEAYKAYTRDRRTRTNKSEQVLYSTGERAGGDGFTRPAREFNREGSDRYQRDNYRSGYKREGGYNRRPAEEGEQPRRRSFNPNFNRDNTPNFTPRPRRPYGEERTFDEGRGYGDKSYGERNYGEKRFSERSSGERAGGERRPYGDRGMSEARPYGERRFDRRSYGEGRPNEGRPYREHKPRGEERPYGERTERPYGDRPQNGYRKSYGEGGARGEKRFSKPRYDSEHYPTYPAPVIEDQIRLNRYIAMSGICSRREADEYILSGTVTVNDQVVTELGSKVGQGDVVKLDGKVLQNEKMVYIVMNKPKGYVTSVDDPHADKTVMDLLKGCCKERVYPVGRLDKNSMGVLLITNDGELTKQIAHPSYEKRKVYQVTIDKPMERGDMERLLEGVELEDGPIKADAIDYVTDKKTDIGVEIHSGRNRIVRRMFEKVGYHVLKLDRVYFAGLTKQRLKRGAWRFLTPREVTMLKSGSYE